mgnify:CR=1 FL=1
MGPNTGRLVARLRLWEAYDEVFRAWRDEWTSDSKEYRGQRALRMMRAVRFASQLKFNIAPEVFKALKVNKNRIEIGET